MKRVLIAPTGWGQEDRRRTEAGLSGHMVNPVTQPS